MKNMKNKMKTYRDMMKLKKMTETDKEFGILLLIMAGPFYLIAMLTTMLYW